MTAEEFIFDTPLYHEVSFADEAEPFAKKLYSHFSKNTFDGYNPFQKKESTFLLIQGIGNDCIEGYWHSSYTEKIGIRQIVLRCCRYNDKMHLLVRWNPEERTITKIGQYPSVADVHIGQIKQYKKVLSNDKLKEFTRAIVLAANGIGVGSFIYLRRIFESLIYEIANKAITNGVIKKEDFEQKRMDERVYVLKELLPSFLVENKSLYGILSKGIHELSEEKCLAYFDIMRNSIELILDERLDAIQKAEKIKKASNALNAIQAQIKKSI